MARTPDPIGEELNLADTGADPSAIGAISNNAGALKGRDATGVFNLRSGTGLTEAAHRSVDHLVHAIAEPSHDQFVYTGNRVDAVITWETSAMLKKIREELYTYASGKVSVVVTKHYDAAGVLLAGETMTETFTYSGQQVASVARTVA